MNLKGLQCLTSVYLFSVVIGILFILLDASREFQVHDNKIPAVIQKNSYNGLPAVARRHLLNEIRDNFDHSNINLTLLRLCHFPPSMRTNELVISFSKHSTWASQRCILGYTFPEGISRTLVCWHEKNYWEPTKFEECQPYIDCTLSLTTKGEVSCVSATAWKPRRCNVTCDAMAIFERVQQEVECDVHGVWQPNLPFCAIAGGAGYDLVPAPKIRLHSNHTQRNLQTEKYPEPQYEDKVAKAIEHLEKLIEEENRPKGLSWYERPAADVFKELLHNKSLDLDEERGNKIAKRELLDEAPGKEAEETELLDETHGHEVDETRRLDEAHENGTEHLDEADGNNSGETK